MALERRRGPWSVARDCGVDNRQPNQALTTNRRRIRNPLDTSNFDNFDNCEVEPPPVPASRADKHTQWDLWEWIDK